MSARPQQGAANGLPLLDLKSITKLCDAAMHMFGVFYDIERQQKHEIKARLAAEFDRLDLFGPGEHYHWHEDYRPSGDQR